MFRYLLLRINLVVTRAGGCPPAFPSQPFNLIAMFLKATLSYFQGRGGGNATLLHRWILLVSGDSCLSVRGYSAAVNDILSFECDCSVEIISFLLLGICI